MPKREMDGTFKLCAVLRFDCSKANKAHSPSFLLLFPQFERLASLPPRLNPIHPGLFWCREDQREKFLQQAAALYVCTYVAEGPSVARAICLPSSSLLLFTSVFLYAAHVHRIPPMGEPKERRRRRRGAFTVAQSKK